MTGRVFSVFFTVFFRGVYRLSVDLRNAAQQQCSNYCVRRKSTCNTVKGCAGRGLCFGILGPSLCTIRRRRGNVFVVSAHAATVIVVN